MPKFLSGRQKNLKIGVTSYTENQLSLEVIGRVGIGSTLPSGNLDVVGNVNVSGSLGVGTISASNFEIGVGASISIAGYGGSDGQYLRSTGLGVTWSSFPNLRTGFSTIGTSSQTTIQTIYNIDYVDIFINGVLLNNSEYTASNGIDIILNDALEGGEIIDIFSYNTTSTYSGGSGTTVVIGGGGTSFWNQSNSGIYTNTNVGIFTNEPTSALSVSGDVLVSGIITASLFSGDGSGLTNIISTGSGVEILDSGNLVGTASTINFGDNLSVSQISAGIVTVSAADISTIYWDSNSSGIHTQSKVGIGTTDVTSDLVVNGSSLFTGISTFKDNILLKDNNIIFLGDGNDLSIFHNTDPSLSLNTNYIYSQNSRDLTILGQDLTSLRIQSGDTLGNCAKFEYGGSVELYYQTLKKFETTNYGILITGSIVGDGSSLSGVVTSIVAGSNITISESGGQVTINASGGGGGGESYWTQYSTGISTTSNVGIGTTNATSKLTVDGDGYFTGIITANQFTTQTGGTPTIDSPNNLNINANTVAISTNLTVGGSVSFNGEIDSHYIPSIDNTYDIGSSSKRIRDLYISNNSIIFENGNKLGINTNGNLSIDGNTIEARIQGTYNVMDYGAVADGSTDDTSAFNTAVQAAGNYGNVYAPPGNYKVNGITITGDGQNINIDGTLIIGANEKAIIFDKPSGTSTQYCKLYVKEIKHTSTTQRPSDNSTGIYFRNGSFNTVEFGRIGFLHYGVILDPSTKTPTEGLTSDNRIKGQLIEFSRIGIYSNGGSNVSQNHTEHTIVEINFIAHYQYGIYKTNSTGSQKFWHVTTALDAFPGPNNTDYVADIFDDYVQSEDDNLSSCWYQCYFSTDNNTFKGNAFEFGRNCFLFDVTRRRTHFGNRIKMDTYLGEIECTGPSNALDAGGLVLTSPNGTKFRLTVNNSGTIGVTTIRYVPDYVY